jgi:hypothetical protein
VKILTKKQYYEMASTCKFGNKLMTWDGRGEWEKSGYSGPIRFRSKVPGSRIFTSGKPYEGPEILAAYKQLLETGAAAADEVVFCEPAPEEYLTIQGEIFLGDCGFELGHSTEPNITCREAMTRASHSRGLRALSILRSNLDPQDFEDLIDLTLDYPDHVVEFSSYSKKVGVLDRRLVVWEVRLF